MVLICQTKKLYLVQPSLVLNRSAYFHHKTIVHKVLQVSKLYNPLGLIAFIYLFIYLFTYLFIYLFIYLVIWNNPSGN